MINMKNIENIIDKIQNLKDRYCDSAYLEIKKILGENGIIENKSKEQEIQIKLDKINISVKYDKIYSHEILVENSNELVL